MDNLLVETASIRQKVAAGTVAFVILLSFFVLAPVATQSAASVSAFLPAFATAMFVTAGLTSLLLGSQFLLLRTPVLGILSAAYLFTTVIVSIQLLASPGVFTPPLLLETGPQSAVWLWVFWQAGFPLFILAAMLAQQSSRLARVVERHAHLALTGFVGSALAIAALSVFAATHYVDLLPDLISAADQRTLSQNPIALFVWLINLSALLAVVTVTRLRNTLHLWLAVAVLASVVSVSLTLLAGDRYSMGWYGARMLGIISSAPILAAILWQFNRLYRELMRLTLTLADSSLRDSLTGIYNRRYMDTQLTVELGRARRHEAPLSLLMIDVDHFALYNDTFGHQRGDSCLIVVAEALIHEIHRPADFIARFAGPRFAVVLPDTDAAGAAMIAERMRCATEKRRIAAPEGVITVSVGTATYVFGDSAVPDALIASADAALAAAKRQGRNRVGGGAVDATEPVPEVS